MLNTQQKPDQLQRRMSVGHVNEDLMSNNQQTQTTPDQPQKRMSDNQKPTSNQLQAETVI